MFKLNHYPMFYVAEALLLSKNMAFSTHSAVGAAFGKEFAKTRSVPAEYHGHLIDAADARNVGDYQVVSRQTAEEASLHIDRAEQLLSVGEEFLARSADTGA